MAKNSAVNEKKSIEDMDNLAIEIKLDFSPELKSELKKAQEKFKEWKENDFVLST